MAPIVEYPRDLFITVSLEGGQADSKGDARAQEEGKMVGLGEGAGAMIIQSLGLVTWLYLFSSFPS